MVVASLDIATYLITPYDTYKWILPLYSGVLCSYWSKRTEVIMLGLSATSNWEDNSFLVCDKLLELPEDRVDRLTIETRIHFVL